MNTRTASNQNPKAHIRGLRAKEGRVLSAFLINPSNRLCEHVCACCSFVERSRSLLRLDSVFFGFLADLDWVLCGNLLQNVPVGAA